MIERKNLPPSVSLMCQVSKISKKWGGHASWHGSCLRCSGSPKKLIERSCATLAKEYALGMKMNKMEIGKVFKFAYRKGVDGEVVKRYSIRVDRINDETFSGHCIKRGVIRHFRFDRIED